jgi:hypothetical protein
MTPEVGCLTYAATCSAVRGGLAYWWGVVSASGVEGRAGLVTSAVAWLWRDRPAMKRALEIFAGAGLAVRTGG